ncbi:unnamed protein product [Arabis nemorensis]|uniref:Major facilitator superfamily (MFS) profile domain-containing protein n=1 Tax=Arabis nemorensis TaxID=586526 RepID=A0A565AW48_9BRAS|nr:unnamed protein product [Arabis nemorensis]
MILIATVGIHFFEHATGIEAVILYSPWIFKAAGITSEDKLLLATVGVAFFSIGLGPITWVYSSEIFPSRLRAQGASIGIAVNRIMNAMISMSFMSITNAISTGGAFFVFAGFAVTAWWFFFFMFPETMTLEEIEKLFGGGDARGDRNGLEIQTKKINN